jgi:hypothetical protein
MIKDASHILKAFEHLLDLLEEEDVDAETIGAVESAKELFEEEVDGYRYTEEDQDL